MLQQSAPKPRVPSIQRVQEALQHLGFSCQVLELPQSTHTAAEAAQAVGCTIGQIVKSLVFRGKETHKPILILASGANRVDEKALARLVGEPIEKADADFVREQTGFAIGGVPPIGHIQPLPTYIDQDLMQYEEIWAAAGTPHAVFPLTPADLVRMTGGTVTPIG